MTDCTAVTNDTQQQSSVDIDKHIAHTRIDIMWGDSGQILGDRDNSTVLGS